MPPERAPQPARTFFDPYNSSSTGHQRPENHLSGGASWRISRTRKLAHQLRDPTGGGGQTHFVDLVGARSENFVRDGRREDDFRETGALDVREKGLQDIRGLLEVNKKRKSEETAQETDGECRRKKAGSYVAAHDPDVWTQFSSPASSHVSSQQPTQFSGSNANTLSDSKPEVIPSAPQIFRCLALYLNGSTHASGISDHKLKSLFVQHGGSLSISLGRRTVTHVVLGTSGGGLAAGKIQKEVARIGGKGVKYVTAKWVVDSVECGRRLPESRYQAVHIALKSQGSMLGKLSGMKQQQSEDTEISDDSAPSWIMKRSTPLTRSDNIA